MPSIKPAILLGGLCLIASIALGQNKPVIKDTALTRVDSLKAAIVTAPLRPHLKDDTLEYNTEHIRLRQNSAVEDLLRRLPGLHIDPDGTITYNGEKIQHLLVDGEDIFGDDPRLVTKTFDADKISKVQILDRKTTQTLFTGIDDGTRIKTLNLVLKDAARNGYFGRVEAGGNTAGQYTADGALAAFRQKEQFTALGLSTNTGVLGFTSNSGGAPASVNFVNDNSDPLGASAGKGIPRFNAAALHYANTWNNIHEHVMVNYQYSHFNTEPLTTTQTLQTQPDSVYEQKQQAHSINVQDQQWLHGTYDWDLTKSSALQLNFFGARSHSQNQLATNGKSSFNDTLVNTSQRNIQDHLDRQEFGGNLGWRIQPGKNPNQVISITAGGSKNDVITNGYLYSLNQFFQPSGASQTTDTTDQRKQITMHALSLFISTNYVQPLWKGAMLGISYQLSTENNKPLQATYTRDNGKYEEMADSLSTWFQTNTQSQNLTVNLQGKTGRLRYILGNDWQQFRYYQKDLIADSNQTMHYKYWSPKLRLNYLAGATLGINFNYNSAMIQPGFNQLMPAKNNIDPLHISIGNPDLKPGFTQSFKLELHRFKTTLINIGISLNQTSNSISTKTTTDSLGRQVSQPVNVDGAGSVAVNFSLNGRLLNIDIGFHAGGSWTRSMNYVNRDLSRNDGYVGGGGISLGKCAADKYSFQITTNLTYFSQISSINPSAPVRYWSQDYQGAAELYLSKDIHISSNVNYTWQAKTSSFSSATSVLLCNAWISNDFLQHRIETKFQLNNILNANAGITRTSTANINAQSLTNLLGRYWLLSIIFHFDQKFNKK